MSDFNFKVWLRFLNIIKLAKDLVIGGLELNKLVVIIFLFFFLSSSNVIFDHLYIKY